jgi:hypothetical protein
MRNSLSVVCVLLLAFAAIVGLQAQEQGEGQQAMPQMGPPPEMKEISHLVGKWDVDMQWRNQPPDTGWMPAGGTAEYEYILDGAALRFDFHSEVMGMPMHGLGIQCYDRETDQWQMVWIDNLGARISYSEGTEQEGKTVLVGKEVWQGQEYLSRVTTFNETDTSFDWTMEMSQDGGETWFVTGKATYTKVK